MLERGVGILLVHASETGLRTRAFLFAFTMYCVYVDSFVIFCGCSLEGVNVVLQMLDLLCKLKNDVRGLKV